MDMGRDVLESERFLCCCADVGDGESLSSSSNLVAWACGPALSTSRLFRRLGLDGESKVWSIDGDLGGLPKMLKLSTRYPYCQSTFQNAQCAAVANCTHPLSEACWLPHKR